ncbi:MAG: hypothetical protein J0M18_16090 [Ignavibacteria bacterium]|nr:hypothetical protein [Ignavibacteria bacterium]
MSSFFEAHKNEFSKDQDILISVNVFNARLDSLQQELINAARTSNEICTLILLARSLVIKLYSKISSALRSYAKASDLSLLSRDLYIDVHSLGDNELLEYSLQLLEEASPLEKTLEVSHLKDGEFDSFRNLIDNLKQIVTVPGMMYNFRAKTSEAFDENIIEAEKLLLQLNKAGETITKEKFYSEYLSLSNLVIA